MKYSLALFTLDLFNALISRPDEGHLSGRPLGSQDMSNLWTPEKVASFYNGVEIAHHNFFSEELELEDFARVIISESCQESTGNYNLNVKPVDFNDHEAYGVIQVTPGSVLVDYKRYGEPILDMDGSVFLDPASIEKIDLADPGLSIPIWAWYNKNTVLAGVSLDEWEHRVEWWVTTGGVTKDFGNCLYTWLAGPRSDRHKEPVGFSDYRYRVTDYYIAAGFGNQTRIEEIFSTPLKETMIGVKDASPPA